MIATVSARFNFEAAHRMDRYGPEHPNSRVHGHSYTLTVFVEGHVDPKSGVVIEHDDLIASVKPVVEQLDHSFLNEVPGLEFPTGELIAKWVWTQLEGRLAGLKTVAIERPSIGLCISFSGA